MQSLIWASTVPLHLTHPSSDTPYILFFPRLSYLPLLIPRLSSFYGLPITSFAYEGIQLKNLPVGLLCDLYQPELPWKLELGDGPLFDIHDTFINSVKEADFVRNGTAKGIMSMSKENSTKLWNSVQDNDYQTYRQTTHPLLNPPTPLKHIPLRVYIPSTPSTTAPTNNTNDPPAYEFKTIQTLIPPHTPNREVQTLGSALNSILPGLFPSRRDPILADVILHGAALPFRAPLEEVMREAAYADGWIGVVVRMLDV